jgi:hypothetical protein
LAGFWKGDEALDYLERFKSFQDQLERFKTIQISNKAKKSLKRKSCQN